MPSNMCFASETSRTVWFAKKIYLDLRNPRTESLKESELSLLQDFNDQTLPLDKVHVCSPELKQTKQNSQLAVKFIS